MVTTTPDDLPAPADAVDTTAAAATASSSTAVASAAPLLSPSPSSSSPIPIPENTFFLLLFLWITGVRSLNVAVLLRKASSLTRLRMMLGSNSVFSLKMIGSGLNLTRVPFLCCGPPFFFPPLAPAPASSPSMDCGPSVMGPSAWPRLKDCLNSRAPRHTVTSHVSLSALTTLMPTPCSPPLTVYPLSSPPNFPPACSTVSTVSSDEVPVAGWMSVGMPRPSSSTLTQPPGSSTTVMSPACPACTSSTPLSSTSHTRWCNPLEPVLPMYIPGRLRTGSNPLRTWMLEAP
mmetsp:Transcript_3868/g.9271  ORF Transcript_3868/g.9271 Transcript_3868/m.9271 type:complete len:289 (-) Transcript_3868:82-948(-)